MPNLSVSNARFAKGFSLIEVLVTLLIISMALLGTVGLQAYSLRMNKGSQFRTQAVFLAADLAERIEANKEAAVKGSAGGYVIKSTAKTFTPEVPPDCVTGACSSADLAKYDLAVWQQQVANASALPQSEWDVSYVANGTSGGTYTIRVSWVDRQENISYAALDESSRVGRDKDGTGERFFYTAIRAVFN